jgi:hypothetical protein
MYIGGHMHKERHFKEFYNKEYKYIPHKEILVCNNNPNISRDKRGKERSQSKNFLRSVFKCFALQSKAGLGSSWVFLLQALVPPSLKWEDEMKECKALTFGKHAENQGFFSVKNFHVGTEEYLSGTACAWHT